jgi:hypothetical protein
MQFTNPHQEARQQAFVHSRRYSSLAIATCRMGYWSEESLRECVCIPAFRECQQTIERGLYGPHSAFSILKVHELPFESK